MEVILIIGLIVYIAISSFCLGSWKETVILMDGGISASQFILLIIMAIFWPVTKTLFWLEDRETKQ